MAFRLQSSPKHPGQLPEFGDKNTACKSSNPQSQNRHVFFIVFFFFLSTPLLSKLISEILSPVTIVTSLFVIAVVDSAASNSSLGLLQTPRFVSGHVRLPEGWTVKPTRGCGNGQNCQVFVANPSAER